MMDNLLEAVRWFLIMTPALAALFLVLIFLMALLQARLPEERVRGLFQRQRASTNYLVGAALGTVTPFCSMTTIPVLAALLRSGVPFGPTMAFLISSPLLDGIVLGVLVFLIGLKLTAIYAVVTFFASIGLGAVFARLGFEADVKDVKQVGRPGCQPENGPEQACSMPEGGVESQPAAGPAWRQAWSVAWSSFVPLVPYLVLGTTIGAAVRGFMPVGWILAVAGPDQSFAIPLMAALGLPIYINAEILLPITAALLDKGMGVGAVVALVITGLGMSASETVLLTGFFRPRMIVALVLGYFLVAIGGGVFTTFVVG